MNTDGRTEEWTQWIQIQPLNEERGEREWRTFAFPSRWRKEGINEGEVSLLG